MKSASCTDSTTERAREVFAKNLGVSTDQVLDQLYLESDFGMDSLDMVETAIDLEMEFGIDFDDGHMIEFLPKTVGEALAHITKKVGA